MEEDQQEAVVTGDIKIIRYTDADAKEWRIWLDGVEIFDATEVDVTRGIVWRLTYRRKFADKGERRNENSGKISYKYRGEVRAERAVFVL